MVTTIGLMTPRAQNANTHTCAGAYGKSTVYMYLRVCVCVCHHFQMNLTID